MTDAPTPHDLTRRVFRAVDSRRPQAFAELFATDGTMVFCNAEPLVGRDAIIAANEAFFGTIAGLRHQIVNEWHVGPDTIVETDVTYLRHDDISVTLPVVSIWRVRADGQIGEYRVYADLGPIHATDPPA
jgi:uncharacterized protein (TIGR02246 family)